MQVRLLLSCTSRWPVEHAAGLFYVIDGFLDVSLPLEESSNDASRAKERAGSTASKPSTSTSKTRPNIKSTVSVSGSSSRGAKRSETGKSRASQPAAAEGRHLFTVKPGGIAGYLGTHLLL